MPQFCPGNQEFSHCADSGEWAAAEGITGRGGGGHAVGRVKLLVVEVGAQESYAKVTSALTFVPELD